MTGAPPLRVVFDTNTIISAVIAGRSEPANALRRAVDRALGGEASVIVCPRLLDEIEAVLGRPKLRPWLEPDDLPAVLTWIVTGSTLVDDPIDVVPVCRDPDDDFLVALARHHDAVLVTGDLDLRSLPESAGVRVMSPREFVETLPG